MESSSLAGEGAAGDVPTIRPAVMLHEKRAISTPVHDGWLDIPDSQCRGLETFHKLLRGWEWESEGKRAEIFHEKGGEMRGICKEITHHKQIKMKEVVSIGLNPCTGYEKIISINYNPLICKSNPDITP